jgi:hypothetical protein
MHSQFTTCHVDWIVFKLGVNIVCLLLFKVNFPKITGDHLAIRASKDKELRLILRVLSPTERGKNWSIFNDDLLPLVTFNGEVLDRV